MPLALDVSTEALGLYLHLLWRDGQGEPALGIAQDIHISRLSARDHVNQKAWRELVDAGLVVESPDFGRYGKYSYIKKEEP